MQHYFLFNTIRTDLYVILSLFPIEEVFIFYSSREIIFKLFNMVAWRIKYLFFN